jgi:glutamate-1-semialdehyde 2,1-aminomutase
VSSCIHYKTIAGRGGKTLGASQTQIGSSAGKAALTDVTGDPVADALQLASASYAGRNLRSQALFGEAARYMPGGNTRSALHWSPFPLYMERSAGCRLHDVDGHEYVDALGEFTAGLYGHSDPVIADSVRTTLARGYSNGAPGESEIRLAQLVCERFPSVERVRFCNSGTEANLYALTLARCATRRSKFLCFSGAYHGGVFVFSGGGSPMNVPFDWTVGTFNDCDGARALIESIGSDLAAVIVEPVMSSGGCIPGDRAFLKVLRESCTAVGAILIFDEIVTSRLSVGGMQEIANVSPDMTTFGKFRGAGFSSGAFGGRADIMDLMNPGRPDALPHAGTFNNNVYTMSVGYSALSQVFTPERARRLHADGEALRERLNSVAQVISPAAQFTGCGSIMNVHFVRGPIQCPQDLAREPRELISLFHLDLLERGVYAAARGQINLSLPMAQAEFDLIAAAVESSLASRARLINRIC